MAAETLAPLELQAALLGAGALLLGPWLWLAPRWTALPALVVGFAVAWMVSPTPAVALLGQWVGALGWVLLAALAGPLHRDGRWAALVGGAVLGPVPALFGLLPRVARGAGPLALLAVVGGLLTPWGHPYLGPRAELLGLGLGALAAPVAWRFAPAVRAEGALGRQRALLLAAALVGAWWTPLAPWASLLGALVLARRPLAPSIPWGLAVAVPLWAAVWTAGGTAWFAGRGLCWLGGAAPEALRPLALLAGYGVGLALEPITAGALVHQARGLALGPWEGAVPLFGLGLTLAPGVPALLAWRAGGLRAGALVLGGSAALALLGAGVGWALLG
ncbi:MAG: hypothetical protein JXX28_05930 [Deltaproteobacteria bacterium]|nr:hypothetical protein [Deltaproteobacteria bacterium]